MSQRICRIVFAAVITRLLIGLGSGEQPAVAGDWPQILGPDRNGVAADETLAKWWPNEGPPLLWQRALGRGYAGVAVRGAQAILFYRAERAGMDEEILEAVDV